VQAAKLIRQETGCNRGIDIELTKRIPVAAGLAGGSSDAAATLFGLNQIWQLGLSRRKLSELAAQLGSDVPFFFLVPAAVGRGRGEELTPCPLGTTLHFVLVCPAEGLSTQAVYREVTPPSSPAETRPIEPILSALQSGNAAQVAALLFNRLEEASLRLSPAVAELKRLAASWDCLGHLMSGSGSAYFALCSSADQARDLSRTLQSQNLGSVFVVRSSP